MRKFKTSRHKKSILYIFFMIFFINIMLFRYYDKHIYSIMVDYASSKLEYLTTMYIKKDIVPKNANLDKLITLSKNNQDVLLSMDINTDYAYQISSEISTNIQNNINELAKGKITINDKSILTNNNNVYILVPLLSANRSALLASFGPQIPIKLDFYQYVLATVEVQAKDYGINNILMEVYLTISYEQKLFFPYNEKKYTRDYKMMLASKMISGSIPEAYGGIITSKSSI